MDQKAGHHQALNLQYPDLALPDLQTVTAKCLLCLSPAPPYHLTPSSHGVLLQ